MFNSERKKKTSCFWDKEKFVHPKDTSLRQWALMLPSSILRAPQIQAFFFFFNVRGREERLSKRGLRTTASQVAKAPKSLCFKSVPLTAPS